MEKIRVAADEMRAQLPRDQRGRVNLDDGRGDTKKYDQELRALIEQAVKDKMSLKGVNLSYSDLSKMK